MVFAALVVFMGLVFALPLVRLWRRHRVLGLVVHKKDPVERVIGVALGSLMGALTVWSLVADRFVSWAVPAWVHVAGWGAIAGGLALIVLAQAQMGASWRIGIDSKPTELVTAGLYRWVRNPIYSAMALTLAGVAGVTPHPLPLLAAVAAVAAMALQTRREERHLLRLHGARYRTYASGVGRFIPFVGRLAGS